MTLLLQPAPSAKSGITTGCVATLALSAIGIELSTVSFRSLVKKRNALTKTGSDALKFNDRPCPDGALIGAASTNCEYCPPAGMVTLTGSVDVPASSVRSKSTVTSSGFGLAMATNDLILSV